MNTDVVPYLLPTDLIESPDGSIGVLQHHQVPFTALRTFWLYRVPENTRRGGHAHRSSKQLLICLDGVIQAELEDLNGKIHQFQLIPGTSGLYLPPLCWGSYTFHQNAKALCLASDRFDESDYIRDYQEFAKLRDDHQDG